MAHEIAARGRERARPPRCSVARGGATPPPGRRRPRVTGRAKFGFGSEPEPIANAPASARRRTRSPRPPRRRPPRSGSRNSSRARRAASASARTVPAEGVLTANDALGTAYTVAEIRGARFGGGANRDRNGNRRAALGDIVFGEGAARPPSERRRPARGADRRVGVRRARGGRRGAEERGARGRGRGRRERLVGARAGRAYGGLARVLATRRRRGGVLALRCEGAACAFVSRKNVTTGVVKVVRDVSNVTARSRKRRIETTRSRSKRRLNYTGARSGTTAKKAIDLPDLGRRSARRLVREPGLGRLSPGCGVPTSRRAGAPSPSAAPSVDQHTCASLARGVATSRAARPRAPPSPRRRRARPRARPPFGARGYYPTVPGARARGDVTSRASRAPPVVPAVAA